MGWTFAGGEIIQGEKDIFEDFSHEFPDGTIMDIVFGSLTKADTQSIEVSIVSRSPRFEINCSLMMETVSRRSFSNPVRIYWIQREQYNDQCSIRSEYGISSGFASKFPRG